MPSDGGNLLMMPKQNLCQSFPPVGMLDHVLKIPYHGYTKDQNITFNQPAKNCNNFFEQQSILLVNTMILLKHRPHLCMHGTKTARMALALFLLLVMAPFMSILYPRHFHYIACEIKKNYASVASFYSEVND